MSTQHAPGSWYVFEGYDDDAPQYTVESSVTIAYIRESTFNPNPKATAQLMAAAPELLEALQDLCRRLGPSYFLEQNWAAPLSAIAKATGKDNART